MGEVADLRPTWNAEDEAIDTAPPAFESFFEEQKERLERAALASERIQRHLSQGSVADVIRPRPTDQPRYSLASSFPSG